MGVGVGNCEVRRRRLASSVIGLDQTIATFVEVGQYDTLTGNLTMSLGSMVFSQGLADVPVTTGPPSPPPPLQPPSLPPASPPASPPTVSNNQTLIIVIVVALLTGIVLIGILISSCMDLRRSKAALAMARSAAQGLFRNADERDDFCQPFNKEKPVLDLEPDLRSAAKALNQALLKQMSGKRERDLLAEQIEKLLVQLRKLRDIRCQDRSEILRQCRKKAEDSQVSRDMYNGVFKINLARTMTCPSLDAYKWAAKEVQRMLSDPPLCEQCQSDVADLYTEAIKARSSATKLMKKLIAGDTRLLSLARPGAKPNHGGALTGVKLNGGGLKGISRICEKIVLQPEGTGGAKKICDVVRDMFVCDTMATVAELLTRVACYPGIELVRFKDRITTPSHGWRDALINYKVKGTPDHICELQIVHAKMLEARAHFGGHEEYSRDRNAREILEYLGEPERILLTVCVPPPLQQLQPKVAPASPAPPLRRLHSLRRLQVQPESKRRPIMCWSIRRVLRGGSNKVGSVAPQV